MVNRAFGDTSAFYALVSRSDRYHHQERLIYTKLIDERWDLFTSSYVLVETIALIHHRLGFPAVEQFVKATSQTIQVVWVNAQVHQDALNRFREKQGRRLSFVDCTSLVLARLLTASVFAFDADFQQEGLPLVSV